MPQGLSKREKELLRFISKVNPEANLDVTVSDTPLDPAKYYSKEDLDRLPKDFIPRLFGVYDYKADTIGLGSDRFGKGKFGTSDPSADSAYVLSHELGHKYDRRDNPDPEYFADSLGAVLLKALSGQHQDTTSLFSLLRRVK